jgi:hypothetical protein
MWPVRGQKGVHVAGKGSKRCICGWYGVKKVYMWPVRGQKGVCVAGNGLSIDNRGGQGCQKLHNKFRNTVQTVFLREETAKKWLLRARND